MTKIPQSKIDEISSSLDIVDVISAYTPLRKAGRSFMGRCPFHEEKTPSFSVSQDKGVYHCFGCGKSGNMFTFIMDTESVTFFDAVKLLADKANITIEFENEPYDPDKNKIELYYDINRKAGKYYYDKLMSREGAYAKEYLNERGLKDDTITKFGLGYSPRDKDALFREFENDFTTEDLQNAGLVLILGAGEIRDRFRGRLMFPIFNESGKVVGFGGRRMYDEATDEAKYVNSPETKIYNKSKTLYGLNFAKGPIKQKGFAILVEGYMDLISLCQNGIENVVASSGTSLTQLQIKTLMRYTKEIVAIYDYDFAGLNAAQKASSLINLEDSNESSNDLRREDDLFSYGLNVRYVVLPPGEDPDSYIKSYGKESFDKLLEKRLNFVDFIAYKYTIENRLESPEDKANFIEELIPILARIPHQIKQKFYINHISEKFKIFPNLIIHEIQNFNNKNKKLVYTKNTEFEKIKIEKASNDKCTAVELVLIRLLIDSDGKTKERLMNELELDLIRNDTVKKIVNYIMMNIDSPEKLALNQLFNEFQDEEGKSIIGKSLLDENYVMQGGRNRNYMNEANQVLGQLKLANIRNTIKEIEAKIKSIDSSSPEILEMLNTQQKLRREQMQIENSMKTL